MRIISGKFKRKTIHPPKNFKARPTTDVAKESLFNMLENEYAIENLKILDLFGGTGSISYEFASRGCKDITCVEINFNHYNFIKKTIHELGIENDVHVTKANVFNYLPKCPHKFDLIFADPPYDLKNIESIPELVFKYNLLLPESTLIVEHSDKTLFSNSEHFTRKKTYGSVNFSFFEI
ncbi:MAG: 16S rRNA (guanine(966)-N(2))-methyltransferase RsmD [Salinivirgaceae bacterium]|jgi:16S rRNA (guanine966-N2)-methyltransferase|nr:16S rRNA (guanine(966)-N(2))-methyltransferase RsmD [Salinivirgaceae bacterium]